MSAITLFSISSVLSWTEVHACAQYVPAGVVRLPQVPRLTRKWTVEVDEKGQRRLVARWASTH